MSARSWELVAAVQAGDQQAFGVLYERYLDRVRGYIGSRVRGRELVDDLTSETFTRALEQIDGVRDQGRDVLVWLLTIARNLILDHFKSSASREIAMSTLPDIPAKDEVERDVLARLDGTALRAAVQRLTPAQRACIRLRYGHELPYQRIGDELGCSPTAAKAAAHRAVRALSRRMTVGGGRR